MDIERFCKQLEDELADTGKRVRAVVDEIDEVNEVIFIDKDTDDELGRIRVFGE